MSAHNPYLHELLNRAKQRYSKDRLDMSTADWICENTTLRNKPFNFDRFPFQEAIVNDWHPNMDVIKPSQVGLTEVQIRKSCAFLVRNPYTSLIFTFPHTEMRKKNSQTRIQPLVKENDVFNLDNGSDTIRSMTLMSIGQSFLMVSIATEEDATSTPADVVMNDELDLSDPKYIALFNSRMQNSDWRINQRFSTPTFPNAGVDLGYQSSDQRQYLVRCYACNHWQAPEFTREFVVIPGLPDSLADLSQLDSKLIEAYDIDVAAGAICCSKCHRPLDLGNKEAREWVAKYPSRTLARGYQVTPFSVGHLGVPYIIDQLLKYKKLENMRGWYNTVLGRPYSDPNAQIPLAAIERAFTGVESISEPSRFLPAWLGIDMGHTCHLVLGTGDRIDNITIQLFETVPIDNLLERVKELKKDWRIVGGTLDRHPLEPNARAVRDEMDFVVLPAEYRGQQEVNFVKDKEGNIIHLQLNRTQALDEVARQMRRGTLRFQGYGSQKAVITEHLRDLVRDESPEQEATWIKLTGNDHYFHAIGFMLAGVKYRQLEYLLDAEPRSVIYCSGVNIKTETGNMLGDTKSLRGVTPWLIQ